jgi:hypothetical protein
MARSLPALCLTAATAAAARRRRLRERWPARAEIVVDPTEGTTIDASGAVRSVQAADLTLTQEQLDALWSPTQLERLARTYWRYLSRVTLGLIRVDYADEQRTIVLVNRRLRLLRFRSPEYAMDADRGVVRWRIEDGVLVEQRGHGGEGYLQIDVRRCAPAPDGRARIHVEVEVANFYPSIAKRFSRPVYIATQSRIHILVGHGFLRSLARLDLARSRVGRFAELSVGDVPDPPLAPTAAQP